MLNAFPFLFYNSTPMLLAPLLSALNNAVYRIATSHHLSFWQLQPNIFQTIGVGKSDEIPAPAASIILVIVRTV